MKSARICLLSLLFVVPGLLGTSTASAQYLGDLHLGVSRGLLGDGDDAGTVARAAVARQLTTRLGVSLGAGYMNTTDRGADVAAAEWWQYREVVTGEAVAHVDVLRLGDGTGVKHILGIKGGAGVLRQWFERPITVWYPPFALEQMEAAGIDRFVGMNGTHSLRLFETPEGVYAVHMRRDDLTTAGWLGGLYYALDMGRVTLTLDAAFREYRTGATLFDYGMRLGYRFSLKDQP